MNPFRLNGGAGRGELLVTLSAWIALMLLARGLGESATLWPWSHYAAALSFVGLAALLATLVRRLHDIGRPGGWAVLAAVPGVSALLVLALLVLPRRSRRYDRSAIGIVIGGAVLSALCLLALLRLFWQPVWLTSGAMKPTLLIGDYVIARHVEAGDVARGDVLVFRHPVENSDHIRRLIGLPGDRVQMRDGRVWLNGVELPQLPAGRFEEEMAPQGPLRTMPRCEGGPVGLRGICRRSRLTETLPDGRSHDVLNIEDGGFADNTVEFIVPDGHYFFLGDNRDNSMDSRFATGVGGTGMVSAGAIHGRVGRVLISSGGARLWYLWDWRGERLLAKVR
ncbi:signal peptidase I [Pseudogemmobacter sonorensis]|uniref:signal peptidase I n=1 Tax=Pseudogemmobacter sonorensis TaxID=2989681 RepID=UPI0036889DB7